MLVCRSSAFMVSMIWSKSNVPFSPLRFFADDGFGPEEDSPSISTGLLFVVDGKKSADDVTNLKQIITLWKKKKEKDLAWAVSQFAFKHATLFCCYWPHVGCINTFLSFSFFYSLSSSNFIPLFSPKWRSRSLQFPVLLIVPNIPHLNSKKIQTPAAAAPSPEGAPLKSLLFNRRLWSQSTTKNPRKPNTRRRNLFPMTFLSRFLALHRPPWNSTHNVSGCLQKETLQIRKWLWKIQCSNLAKESYLELTQWQAARPWFLFLPHLMQVIF